MKEKIKKHIQLPLAYSYFSKFKKRKRPKKSDKPMNTGLITIERYDTDRACKLSFNKPISKIINNIE